VAPSRLASVPWSDFTSWVGGACQFTPLSCRLNLGRGQDPAGLFEAGKSGLPLLVIGGKEDLQVRTDEVVKHMEPHFKICESMILDGVGHMPFYECVI
jgi:pimeloyl-ACP methyl ester carboxylesterase